MHEAHNSHRAYTIATILEDHAHIRELIGASSRPNCRDVALLAAAQAAELHEIAEPEAFSVLGLGRPPMRCETTAQAALAAMTEFQNARHSAGADHVDALAEECRQTVLDHLHTEERWLGYATDWPDVIEPAVATTTPMTEERFLADSGWPTSNRFDYGTLEWRAAVADHEILRIAVRRTYDGIHIQVDRGAELPGTPRAEGGGTVRRNILSAFAYRDEPGTLRFTASRPDTRPCTLRPADALQIITSLTRGMGPASFRTHGTASARSVLAPTGMGRPRHDEVFGPRV